MAFAIGRFQPGTFLWGCAHAEAFYQKVVVDAKCLMRRDEVLPAGANSKRRYMGSAVSFNFLPI